MEDYKIITRKEKEAILYYQKSGKNFELSNEQKVFENFYQVEKSYQIINTLLMPGITNEKTRLVEEGKTFPSSMLDNMEELLQIYYRIYSAMCKYTFYYEKKDNLKTFRGDRQNTMDCFQDGESYTFLSTSLNNKLNEYFLNKSDAIILEIEANKEVESIDFNHVLGEESRCPEHEEILYAPFLSFEKKELNLTKQEMSYRDINNNPPKAKYSLLFNSSTIIPHQLKEDDRLIFMYNEIINSQSIGNAKQVWRTLKEYGTIEEIKLKKYENWKATLQQYLKIQFANIKYNILNESIKV